jgi:hypothetical protein
LALHGSVWAKLRARSADAHQFSTSSELKSGLMLTISWLAALAR